MDYTMFFDDLIALADSVLIASEPAYESTKLAVRTCPEVSRVIFNGDYTIVYFNDNTKIAVKRGAGDPEDRQTAVVYAIAKRLFWKGEYDKKGNPDVTGFYSWIQRLVDNGFDQQTAEANEAKRKAEAKAAHDAKQAAEHDAAVKRKIARRAKQIEIEREAQKLADAKTAALDQPKKTVICEKTDCQCKKSNSKIAEAISSESTKYIRPNKKFKDFTQTEKRAYWRNANMKRKRM